MEGEDAPTREIAGKPTGKPLDHQSGADDSQVKGSKVENSESLPVATTPLDKQSADTSMAPPPNRNLTDIINIDQ